MEPSIKRNIKTRNRRTCLSDIIMNLLWYWNKLESKYIGGVKNF